MSSQSIYAVIKQVLSNRNNKGGKADRRMRLNKAMKFGVVGIWQHKTDSCCRAWQADWLQVVFSDESLFNLWNHDGRMRVRRSAGERYLPECVIERNSGLTTGVMVWDAISYHGRSNLLRFEGNLNSNRYVREVLHLEVVPFLQSIPGAIFQQDNAHSYVAKTVRDFCNTFCNTSNTCNFFLGLLIRRLCHL
ncbi:transposable element Tc1 transposase [Trichonephila clavipes]|nr:transposable element Tc1 transposase [Trichonephila clavipes]